MSSALRYSLALRPLTRRVVFRRNYSAKAKITEDFEKANQVVEVGAGRRKVGTALFCVWLATCFYLPVLNFRYQQYPSQALFDVVVMVLGSRVLHLHDDARGW